MSNDHPRFKCGLYRWFLFTCTYTCARARTDPPRACVHVDQIVCSHARWLYRIIWEVCYCVLSPHERAPVGPSIPLSSPRSHPHLSTKNFWPAEMTNRSFLYSSWEVIITAHQNKNVVQTSGSKLPESKYRNVTYINKSSRKEYRYKLNLKYKNKSRILFMNKPNFFIKQNIYKHANRCYVYTRL